MTAGTLAATEIGGGSTVGVAAKAYGSWGFICRLVRRICRDWCYSRCFHRTAFYGVPWQQLYRRSSAVVSARPAILITSILSMLATITLAGVQITATATIISVPQGFFNRARHPHLWRGNSVIYTMSGGMWSVTMTDVIHFFVLVGASPSRCRSYCNNVGGWESVVTKLPPEQLRDLQRLGWKPSSALSSCTS